MGGGTCNCSTLPVSIFIFSVGISTLLEEELEYMYWIQTVR